MRFENNAADNFNFPFNILRLQSRIGSTHWVNKKIWTLS